jgi:hypothetical protein
MQIIHLAEIFLFDKQLVGWFKKWLICAQREHCEKGMVSRSFFHNGHATYRNNRFIGTL